MTRTSVGFTKNKIAIRCY